ncbi:DNA polymerase thumb domain-containing protein [Jidongwangia harbinensis]|uniref:DNA polymerase thumb domain-containing protein n=1 Tax=Jidongwangia harbinensis TaxID=2878561 RepID=UPI003558E73F
MPAGQEVAVLLPLPVNRLGGVGPATAQRLHRAGIRTIGDLATASLPDLVDWFGHAHGGGCPYGFCQAARASFSTGLCW